jgi:hypothetical protein
MERNRGGGRARRSPICAKCLWKIKRKREKKKLTRKMSLFGLMGRTKIPGSVTASFFFFLLTGQKAFYRPQQNKGGIVVCSTQGLAVCSLYIEDALPSTSRCTCRLNNVHTCQQIANYSHMLFSVLPPTSPTQQLHSPNIRHLG